MKLYTFELHGQRRYGAELKSQLVDLPIAYAALLTARGSDPEALPALPMTLLQFIAAGERALAAARATLAFMAKRPALPVGERATYLFEEVKLLAPIPRPGKILCSGLNYRGRMQENPNASLPKNPRFFAKIPSVVIGPDESIRHPGLKYQIDYGVQLAVVIGQTIYHATQQSAPSHVFGYTILHDVCARWLQFKDNNETLGKNFDTFCPIGPCIVTADEIPDPGKLRLTLKLNGQVMQDRANEDWIFPLPRMLECLSAVMTLEPGDMMSTGTPGGTGSFRKPQRFLKPGDLCRLEIEGIGALENPVVAAGD